MLYNIVQPFRLSIPRPLDYLVCSATHWISASISIFLPLGSAQECADGTTEISFRPPLELASPPRRHRIRPTSFYITISSLIRLLPGSSTSPHPPSPSANPTSQHERRMLHLSRFALRGGESEAKAKAEVGHHGRLRYVREHLDEYDRVDP